MAELQLRSIQAPNRTGNLAAVARRLAAQAVNVDGFVAVGTTLHLVTRDAEKAHQVLSTLGSTVQATAVQEVQLNNRPGALAELCERLAGSASTSRPPSVSVPGSRAAST